MAYLSLKNIRKEFGAAVAVEDFNLDVTRGEFVSFLGPSGCGKTTTMRMIAGFESPTHGTITLDGNDITALAPAKRNVGMVFQSYALFPHLSARDNIDFGLKIAGKSADERKQRIDEMLSLIKMQEHANKYPHQLSGGQQQRVALARAIAVRPQVLLLDEPLSALDAKIRESLRYEIREIQRQLNITTIYVTHDQEEALSISDRVVVMSAGRIEQIGTPLEIYSNPKTSFVADFVGSMNFIPAAVSDAQGHVRFGAHTLALGAPAASFGAGAAVKLALRPEEVRVLAADAACGDCLSATIQNAEFMGTTYRLHLVGAEFGKLLAEVTAHQARSLQLVSGANVKVQLPADMVRVFA